MIGTFLHIADKHMFLQIRCMEVREHYLVALVAHQIIQRISLEIGNVLPALMHAVID